MSFSLFGKKKKYSAALIEIGSASVGGAYVHGEPGKIPTIYYTARLPIETREGEEVEAAMLRTLGAVNDMLIRIGAPILQRETGSGHLDEVLASVNSPWQETSIHTSVLANDNKSFVFTHALLSKAVADAAALPKGRVSSGESVIATILNGYETKNPFEKRVTRAELSILSSSLDRNTSHEIERSIRHAYHTSAVTITGFARVSYGVFRQLFPHEKDFLIIDVSGESTDILFVKRGFLADIHSVHCGLRDLFKAGRDAAAAVAASASYGVHRFEMPIAEAQKEWLNMLSEALRAFASKNPLPRTIFLLADEEARGFLERAINDPALHSLWLSDELLNIIAIQPRHIAPYVRIEGEASGDTFLGLLALFYTQAATSALRVPAKETAAPK